MSHQISIAGRVALLISFSCSLLLYGQDNTQNAHSNQNRTVTHPLLVNVTGCLKKNSQTGGYYVADQNGRTWELTSKKIDLAKHIFHTVSVSGHPSSGPTTQEGKSEPQFGLDVTELEMVSNSCTR